MTSEDFPYLYKEVSARTLATKRRLGKCKHWGCANPVRSNNRWDCYTCNSRKSSIKNPATIAYRNLKSSAKKRGIEFTISLESFKEFDKETGYTAASGRDKESLSVDRIDPKLGYVDGNIRVLTLSQNASRLVDGMTDPIEPIAKALAEAHGDEFHFKYLGVAKKVLLQVEILQESWQDGIEIDPENDPDYNPF